MNNSKIGRQQYIAVWREVLRGWLRWDEHMFNAFVARYDADLDGCGNPLFYHYDELYYVLSYLIPESVSRQLTGKRTQFIYYDDLAALMAEIGDAITQRPRSDDWGTPSFDWPAAQKRVLSIIQHRGFELPVINGSV